MAGRGAENLGICILLGGPCGHLRKALFFFFFGKHSWQNLTEEEDGMPGSAGQYNLEEQFQLPPGF